ncbi:MAG TPA: hypothetical protein VLI90_11450 [Tepidisphaeraceae bacterium]|nr:hypothetical protein [Tepidisphaeraceae bacterium]
MSSLASTIRISGLGKDKLTRLRAQAKACGVTAGRYAKQLIEDGLSLDQQARSTTFDELMAPVRSGFRSSGMSQPKLAALVDRARTQHRVRFSGKHR